MDEKNNEGKNNEGKIVRNYPLCQESYEKSKSRQGFRENPEKILVDNSLSTKEKVAYARSLFEDAEKAYSEWSESSRSADIQAARDYRDKKSGIPFVPEEIENVGQPSIIKDVAFLMRQFPMLFTLAELEGRLEREDGMTVSSEGMEKSSDPNHLNLKEKMEEIRRYFGNKIIIREIEDGKGFVIEKAKQ